MHENCLYRQADGHDTEKCLAHRIQDLIDDKIIPSPRSPNVTNKPLPNHTPRINTLIIEEEDFDLVYLITNIPTSLPNRVEIYELEEEELDETLEGLFLKPTQ